MNSGIGSMVTPSSPSLAKEKTDRLAQGGSLPPPVQEALRAGRAKLLMHLGKEAILIASGLGIGLSACSVFILAPLLQVGSLSLLLTAFASALACGTGWLWLKKPSWLECAQILDRALGAKDRLTSALLFAALPTPKPIHKLQLEEAAEFFKQRTPLPPLPLPRSKGMIWLSAGLITGAMAWLVHFFIKPQAGAFSAVESNSFGQIEKSPEKLAQNLEELEKWISQERERLERERRTALEKARQAIEEALGPKSSDQVPRLAERWKSEAQERLESASTEAPQSEAPPTHLQSKANGVALQAAQEKEA
ncbi:MAG: hypothetical protein NZM37_07080, partial [Sandaracinaceae bacterium]|nr:hypothetical protein [Sandaracinaceae bacterium]